MKYRAIVVDPPWPVAGDGKARSRPWAGKGGRRGRDTFFPYETQSLEWIHSLPVIKFADSSGCHLYLWITAKLNREGEGVKTVHAWGFELVSEIVWHKPNFGLGKFPRPAHEIILVGRRGNIPFRVNNVGSVQTWKQNHSLGKRHSAKPEGFFDLVELASPGPYLELFARRQRLGWHTWGDECFQQIEFFEHAEEPQPLAFPA